MATAVGVKSEHDTSPYVYDTLALVYAGEQRGRGERVREKGKVV